MENNYVEELKKLLASNISNSVKSKQIAIAFSGGLDSSILAKLIVDLGFSPIAYVAGIENCQDFEAADIAAEQINIPLKKIILNKNEIKDGIKFQSEILRDLYEKNKGKINLEINLNSVSVSYNLPLYFVVKNIPEKYVVLGSGADTMFGGFAKYIKLRKEDAIKQMKKETKDLMEFKYKELLETARFFNKEVIIPFVDKRIAEFCLRLPFELKIKGNQRKYILVKLAKQIGLSDELAFRKKKSAQYGSGIMKTMIQISKQENVSLNDYLKKILKTKFS